MLRKTTRMLKLTTFIDQHDHNAQDQLKVTNCAPASLTSSLIIDEVSNHIDKRASEIKKTLLMDYGVQLTYKQAYRAKEKAKQELQGNPEHSYMLIPWICDRLKETDPKTVAEWDFVRPVVGGHIFRQLFIAYGCCIDGFLAGARPILYIDGTHLKGPYMGKMLSASAYDANNDMFPFAIGIVGGETSDDWGWFLEMIKKVGGSIELTIVSDRHQAIKTAVEEIFGGERHAYYFRHVKENFSQEMNKINNNGKRLSQQMKDDRLILFDNIAYARNNLHHIDGKIQYFQSTPSTYPFYVIFQPTT